jgi:signal transduction histidine kinase
MEGVLFLAKRAQSAFADSVVDAAVSAAEQVGLAFLLAERARRDAELAVAEERRRVAVALHDSVGALLFSIRASARALQDQFAQDEVGRAEAELIGRHAGEAATALHTSLQALHATATEIALGVRLREEAQHFAQRSGVRARAIFTTDVPALHAARVQTLVDVVREALRNVEKHAQARSVMVTVFADEAMVNLLVADDGIGFEGKSPAVGSGLGLGVASDALERLGGCLTVEQNVDGGTTVRARIPV